MSQHPISRPTTESWENEGGSLRSPGAGSPGVKRVLTETFAVGCYAYTNRADAVAQARRLNMQSADL